MIMEDIVEMMRTRDINFNSSRARGDSGSFDISFQYGSAADRAAGDRGARRRCSSQENPQDREVLAEQTDEFLGSQLLEVERQLKEREKQLADFKRTHPGAMPQQAEGNQAALQNAQLQLSAVQESISRDRDRQVDRAASARRPDGGQRLAPMPDATAVAGAPDLRPSARAGARCR